MQSRAARVAVDGWLTEQIEPPPWLSLWRDLCDERVVVLDSDGQPVLDARGEMRTRRRWDWRKALYIAWSCVPKQSRLPKTLEELCSLLGLASSGTIRNWRRADPGLQERIVELPRQLLVNHAVDVYDALVSVATTPDPKAFNDRRLFLELIGQYAPKGGVELSGPEGGPVPVDFSYGLTNLSDTDLDTLAEFAQRIAGDPGGAGAAGAD